MRRRKEESCRRSKLDALDDKKKRPRLDKKIVSASFEPRVLQPRQHGETAVVATSIRKSILLSNPNNRDPGNLFCRRRLGHEPRPSTAVVHGVSVSVSGRADPRRRTYIPSKGNNTRVKSIISRKRTSGQLDKQLSCTINSRTCCQHACWASLSSAGEIEFSSHREQTWASTKSKVTTVASYLSIPDNSVALVEEIEPSCSP